MILLEVCVNGTVPEPVVYFLDRVQDVRVYGRGSIQIKIGDTRALGISFDNLEEAHRERDYTRKRDIIVGFTVFLAKLLKEHENELRVVSDQELYDMWHKYAHDNNIGGSL